jgi:uncharacterized ion transporter superfamily protein YfcC
MKFSLKKINIPHVFIFLSGIILFSAVLTYVIPSGEFERVTRTVGNMEQTIVVPGSYEGLSKHYSLKGLVLGENIPDKASPTSLLGLFSSIPKGMNQAASLIFFIFIIGAVLNLINHTGTIRVFLNILMRRFRNSPVALSYMIYMFFAFGATFLGMGAEFIPLIPILLIISKEMGYDRIYGISLLVIGEGIGWSTAITNPFTVQIAQKIAEVPIGSGILLRLVLFAITTTIGFYFLYRYGRMIKKDPSRGAMPEDPFILKASSTDSSELRLERKHILIAVTSFILFGLILFAVQTMGWGLIEMTGGFFTVGLCTILISGMSGDESMKAFIKGLEIMIVPALIVGFARGIQVVLQDGQVIDTMLYYTATTLEQLPRLLAVEGMFLFQSLLNFLIPSASGQALVTMPLMVPLSDLLGISRQTAVLAFTAGDGFSNLIIPTNGVLMAMLGIAGVPFEKWFKFVLPLFIYLLIVAFATLALAVLINY